MRGPPALKGTPHKLIVGQALPSTPMNTPPVIKVPSPVIRHTFKVPVAPNKAARKLAEDEAVREVVRALNEFAYAQEEAS